MKKLCVMLLVVFLIGCAPSWKQAGGAFRSKTNEFTASLPAGWVKEVNGGKIAYVKKEGIPLGTIIIERIVFAEQATEKARFKKGMLPHEITEVLIAELKADPGVSDVKILEVSGATISDLKGSKAVCTCRKRNDVVMKIVYYGVQAGDYGYTLILYAPKRHYFDIYINDFEKMVRNFRFVKS